MTLANILKQPTKAEVINPVLKRLKVDKRAFNRNLRKKVRKLAKEHEDIVVPSIFDTALSYGYIKTEKDKAAGYARSRVSEMYSGIVDSIDNLAGGQVMVLPKEVDLIPDDFMKDDNPKKRFSKRGDVVKLKRYKTIDEAIKAKAHPKKLLRDAASRTNLWTNYIGYDFLGVGDGRGAIFNKVMIEDLVEAKAILRYAKHNEDATVEFFKLYNGAGENNIAAKVRVSSVEKQDREEYEFDLDNLPIKKNWSRSKDYWANWTRIHSLHDCKGRTDSGLHKRTQRGTYNFCKHMIAGYWKLYMDLPKRSQDKYRLMLNPFRCPTKELEEYSQKLKSQVLIEYYNPVKRRHELRKLTKIEREVLDWKRVSCKGYDANFDYGYSKKVREAA